MPAWNFSAFSAYCKYWPLKPSTGKIEVFCSHLNHREVKKKLVVYFFWRIFLSPNVSRHHSRSNVDFLQANLQDIAKTQSQEQLVLIGCYTANVSWTSAILLYYSSTEYRAAASAVPTARHRTLSSTLQWGSYLVCCNQLQLTGFQNYPNIAPPAIVDQGVQHESKNRQWCLELFLV